MLPWAPWARAGAALGLWRSPGSLHHVLSRDGAVRRRVAAVDDEGVRRPGEQRARGVARALRRRCAGQRDRTRFVLALTSAARDALPLGARADAGDAAEAPSLLDRAVTVAESDLRADDAAALCAADAERLLSHARAPAPGALDRRLPLRRGGEPVVLDRGELRVGARRIDLSAPLEWRAFAFQELGAHAASVCQAMWMRQGDGEARPRRPDGRRRRRADAGSGMGEPPPRELRRAIDRLFMAPLRRALERAPRVTRVPAVAAAGRTEAVYALEVVC